MESEKLNKKPINNRGYSVHYDEHAIDLRTILEPLPQNATIFCLFVPKWKKNLICFYVTCEVRRHFPCFDYCYLSILQLSFSSWYCQINNKNNNLYEPAVRIDKGKYLSRINYIQKWLINRTNQRYFRNSEKQLNLRNW